VFCIIFVAMENPEHFFRRNLPHYHPNDAPYFVTFRLNGSLSRIEIERLKIALDKGESPDAHARYFRDYDTLLDTARRGPKYLARPEIREVIRASFAFVGELWLDIIAYSIMPNHVHFVGGIKGDRSLSQVMQSLKGYSAREANLILGKTGAPFWQPENYDHVIRKGKLPASVIYVLNNPVKAGLVTQWEEWPGNYLAPEYQGIMSVPKTI
jgi:putative transposase